MDSIPSSLLAEVFAIVVNHGLHESKLDFLSSDFRPGCDLANFQAMNLQFETWQPSFAIRLLQDKCERTKQIDSSPNGIDVDMADAYLCDEEGHLPE